MSIEKLGQLLHEKLGMVVVRDHMEVPNLLQRAHRFRATDRSGSPSLAKDLARLTADRIDEKAIQKLVKPPEGANWRSLKSLENLLSQLNPGVAHNWHWAHYSQSSSSGTVTLTYRAARWTTN